MQRLFQMGQDWVKCLPAWLVQAVKFGMVGALNTLVDLGLYYLLTRLTGLSQNLVLAKGISYSAGILNSFIWNRNWTFRSKANGWATFIPFVLANLVGLGVNTGMMQLGVHSFHFAEAVSVGLATIFTLGWNFAASKFVVFRK